MSRTPQVDWSQAYLFFAKLGPVRTFSAVAHKFEVSDTAVRKRAAKEQWLEKAAQLDAKALATAQVELTRDHAQRIAQVLHLVDGLLDGYEAKLIAKQLELRVADIPGIVKLAELLTGGATDRVSIAELRDFMGALVIELEPIVGPGQRGKLADAIERAASAVSERGPLALSPPSEDAIDVEPEPETDAGETPHAREDEAA